MAPSRPVDWVTPAPIRERVRYPVRDGEAAGDLYRPGITGQSPGVVVCLGVVPAGVDHPQVARLGTALARGGFAALLYWSPAMRDERLVPEDVASIALAYQWLIAQPLVDAGRSGLIGTCVGASFALMAAADPRVRDRIAFVSAWAPYASMRTMARDIASASVIAGPVRRPWQVDPLTRRVFLRTLTNGLPRDEAARLRGAGGDRDRQLDLDSTTLSAAGRAIYPLLTALDAAAATAAVAGLPPAMQAWLDRISPLEYVTAIHAPLIILAHDRDDGVIPIGESRRLRATLAGRAGVRYTEFTMFKHLDPTRVRLSLPALMRELVRFYRFMYPIFRQAVEPSNDSAPHTAR